MRVATRSRNARSCVMTIAAGCLEQQLLEPVDRRRCRGGWSARRAAAGRARARTPARARRASSRRPTWPPGRASAFRPKRSRNSASLCFFWIAPQSGSAGSCSTSAMDRPSRRRSSPSSSVASPAITREERGLAGAVAADEADALAALQGERRAVEERQLPVREAAFNQGQQWHAGSKTGTVPIFRRAMCSNGK